MGVNHETKTPAKDLYIGSYKVVEASTGALVHKNVEITADSAELNALDGYRHDVYHLSNAIQAEAGRFTLSQVNSGQTIISGEDHAGDDQQWQVLDIKIRAIGGAFEACTSIDFVEETSGNIVFSAPVAALTENAWVTVSTANVVSTYLSVWSTVGKGLLLSVVGDAATTATHLDYVVTYVH